LPIRNGESIRSEHVHDGIDFHLLTMEDQTKTLLRLDEASIRLACASWARVIPTGFRTSASSRIELAVTLVIVAVSGR
jgi:hypothetical protein